ncbi:hypothetical protein SARC_12194 [Sphaeroforma arctica JP610]|uniref:C2H2-type domain-containing protein n=1 Tax=Sphaeroforma arctica JP610 TaxID=667725 RepID=A0A0L0FET3_9EUKA|nr:hypothetical protein SARC_12194 [Sphaeroforma arctica JP610]KNC75279.1 hypothetical protein SARC_12194 [Sphaeroforma arctica JP610]|eukprot:XP_014149181.1 hypothetical protein SARC_12194 [Sphaeroforma arctica JP610]
MSFESSSTMSEEEVGEVSTDEIVSFPNPMLSKNFPCCLCDVIVVGQVEVLEHLALEHKLIVGKVENIAKLDEYLQYWKEKFTTHMLEDFAFTIDPMGYPEAESTVKSATRGLTESTLIYMLSDKLAIDAELRNRLEKERLDEVLAVQERERAASDFKRKCLFCTSTVEGNRADMFQHMLTAHHFNVGLPDNIVFVSEFLDHLEIMLSKLKCLSCEKTFKSQPVLRAHMRKKRHMKVNPNNTAYDRYYIVNYVETGKKWMVPEYLNPSGMDSDSESRENTATVGELLAEQEWDDWEEDTERTVCLLCDTTVEDAKLVFSHMTSAHGFDFEALKQQGNWDFYQCVKIVNYFRRQMSLHRCPSCDMEGGNADGLKNHMETADHYSLPEDESLWNQPQYFFPTIENDPLLSALESYDELSDEDEAASEPRS